MDIGSTAHDNVPSNPKEACDIQSAQSSSAHSENAVQDGSTGACSGAGAGTESAGAGAGCQEQSENKQKYGVGKIIEFRFKGTECRGLILKYCDILDEYFVKYQEKGRNGVYAYPRHGQTEMYIYARRITGLHKYLS